ncbi:Ni/Fe hydrogenase subunit alpha [Desulfosediminicola ganghwensis]|uniref:Ni/Fe hydrogenase subunit alpha n=1 Tax=Desulfosediminicola ganghwensis TaxID=2569540 RepID=UPI0010AC90FB|nr:Ni/Fe hydrogenase subunit alpha [Desulfosediminicola ganghwensis]
MKNSCDISIKHLTRVEGHGNISIKVVEGQLVHAHWEVVESPRFFEAILVGKSWWSAPSLCGRICGICSIGHTLASIRAIERAFGFEPPEQTRTLRLLLKHMETLQSHVLHIFFLAVPDFLNADSLLSLRAGRPEIVELAARLKKLANDGADLIGGRRLHPTRLIVGGFTKLPRQDMLVSLQQRLRQTRHELSKAAELMHSFVLPDFQRETEYVSLKGETRYPFIGGMLLSSDGVIKEEDNYLEMTNEYLTEQSTAKWSRLSRDSFAVGALARLNNNGTLLHPGARAMADSFGLLPACHNPFYNTAAQLVECLHVVEDSERLIGRLLATTWQNSRATPIPRAGKGVGAIEVPRGILYHSYSLDKQGIITKADCVIPTSQNHANIQHDLTKLVAESAASGLPDSEIAQLAAMLVRAYDPCISCSVH